MHTNNNQLLLRLLTVVLVSSSLSVASAFLPHKHNLKILGIRTRPPASIYVPDDHSLGERSHCILKPLQSSSAAAGGGDRTAAANDLGDESESSLVIHSDILQGKSPKALQLRRALQEIWLHPERTSPVILLGSPGSGKRSLAEELVQRLPSTQTKNVYRLQLDDAVHHVDTVLGTSPGPSGHPGLLDELATQANTTLIFGGFQSASADSSDDLSRRQEIHQTLAQLVQNRTFYSSFEEKEKPFLPRIIVLWSSENISFLKDPNIDAFVIKVPALEHRMADMEAIASAKIQHMEGIYGLYNVKLSREAMHRLLDHRWEVGESELDDELCSALELLSLEQQQQRRNSHLPYFAIKTSTTFLESRHMLVNSFNEKMRHRLLYEFPFLRKVIQSPWVFDHTLRYIVTPVFIVVLAILFLGPQTMDHNSVLTIFWAGWWPAVMLAFPFFGRIWCSICPFMAIGNLAQEGAIRLGVELKKWPDWGATVGSAFAFGLFFAILMWEELWNLPQSGALSAWLLLLITSGAVINSIQFENRFWCRYLCPIGAMCRVFGTLSMLEVRSWKTNCVGCTDPKCVTGGGLAPAVDASDGFALQGCTMQLKNNQLRDMGDCTLCMSCVKNCDREVPELNFRPIGLDYGLPWLLPKAWQKAENLSLSQVETNFWMGALVTVLQGSVLVHYMPTILSNLGMDPAIADVVPALDGLFATHLVLTAGLLALPGLLSLAADRISGPLESAVSFWQSQRDSETDSKERQVIIDVYESILKSNSSMVELLEAFDPDGDGQISDWECRQVFRTLNLQDSQCEIFLGAMRKRPGRSTAAITADDRVPLAEGVDWFHELYTNARAAAASEEEWLWSPLSSRGNTNIHLRTKKTFVEIFNDLDQDGDGFVSETDFDLLFEKGYLLPKTKSPPAAAADLFASADKFGTGGGRLNLFEFMSVMRKTVQVVGIQEIGYGYFPLAWASLTAYWLSIGMTELGLVFARLPDTFFLGTPLDTTIPQVVASPELVHAMQAILLTVSLFLSVALTQKLCDDNQIGSVRFGLHASIQVAGAALTLYLMMTTKLSILI